MPTLKERLEAFFVPEVFIRLSQKTKMHAAQKEVFALFRQELQALADDIVRLDKSYLDVEVIAALIRSKADELN